MVSIVNEFTEGFKQFLKDNPDEEKIFNELWLEADTYGITNFIHDYLTELKQ